MHSMVYHKQDKCSGGKYNCKLYYELPITPPGKSYSPERIIVPTARQGRSQGENGNVDRFLMPRDSFTFRGRNEEGQLSNRAEHLSAQAKRGKTAQRS